MIRRILESPVAFSPLVVLFQIPWALAGGFSTSASGLTNQRLAMACLALLYEAVIGLGLAAGAWGVRRSVVLQAHRAPYTLVVWTLTACMTVVASQAFLHIYSGTKIVELRFVLINTLIILLVGFASSTYVIQSRKEHIDAFQKLQNSNEHLARLGVTGFDALQSERQALVETIHQTITPQLKFISSDLDMMRSDLSAQSSSQARELIEEQVLPKLRDQIASLASNEPQELLVAEPTNPVPKPRLALSNLPVAAAGSLIVGIVLGLPIFVSLVGFSKVPLWLIQIVAIYSPIFVLERIAQRTKRASRFPKVFWVVSACVTVVTLRLTIFAGSGFITVATSSHTPPFVVGIVYTFSVLLASLDKYFLDSYREAIARQQIADGALKARLAELEAARRATRRDLAHILHGPIQGRLASVRLRLNMLDELKESRTSISAHDSIGDIADVINEVTLELETLGNLREPEPQLTTINQIALLQKNWLGFITLSYKCSPKAAAALARNPILDKRVAAACMEVTTNASRHGAVSELDIGVDLVSEDSILRLIAQDDGSGVQSSVTPGMGLKEIAAEGGEWQFEPCTTGARLRVDFPMNRELAR